MFRIKNRNFIKKKYLLLTFILSILFLVTSVVLIRLLSLKISSLNGKSLYFYGRNSILTVLLVSSLVLLIDKTKPFVSKPINFIAGSSLGIYLIHDNSDFVRKILWQDIFNVNQYFSNPFMIFYVLGICMIIFIVCLFIDLVRRYSVQLLIDLALGKIKKLDFVVME